MSAGQLSALVRRLRDSAGDDLVGLGGRPAPPGTLLLAYALGSTTTLGAALERLERVGSAVPGLPAFACTTTADTATLSLSTPDATPVMMETLTLLAHRVACWATRSEIPLRRVEFEHQEPLGVIDLRAAFNAPVIFSGGRSTLVFDTAMLSLPLLRDTAELEELVDDAPAVLMSRHHFTEPHLAERVRIIIAHNVCRSQGDLDVAVQMSMSPQTLRRKLREQGTSLTLIRQDVLREAAVAGLAAGTESVAQLAVRLGFSEPSAFTRAFRRWTGVAPTAYRCASAT